MHQRLRIRLLASAAALAVTAGIVVPHGSKSKPFYNVSKANWAIRGAAGAGPVQLYMMQPPLQLTGAHEAVGFEVWLRDEESLTPEDIELSYVKYAANGIEPETSPTGVLRNMKFKVFGPLIGTGKQTANFILSWAFPLLLPDNFGIGVRMPTSPSWPNTDGVSIFAQLNLPNDPLRPRVPPPHDQQVWAYEVLLPSPQPLALGGRTLDSLTVTGLYAGSIIQGFVRSTAYGGAPEDLFGPESMHPSAARGDSFGMFLHANDPNFPGCLVFLSPTKLSTPWCCMGVPNANWYLGVAGPFPFLFQAVGLNAVGQATVGPFPIGLVPPFIRSFYLQAAMVSPAFQVELTDAIGFQGL